MLIATNNDNPTEHYLVLSVNLEKKGNIIYEYNYGFYTLGKDEITTSELMYTRNDVSKYLPPTLKGQIIPLVIEMTRDLITRNNPKQITRQTMERLEDDSLKRYEKITKLLTNELGYIQKRHTQHNGLHEWLFIKNDDSEMRLNEEQLLNYKLSPIEEMVIRKTKAFREVLTPNTLNELLRGKK